MPQVSFIVPAILAGGLLCGWIFALWLERWLDHSQGGTSEELLDELEAACTPRRSLEVRVKPDPLRPLLDCVSEHVDSGFSPRHARHLFGRIVSRNGHTAHHTWYAVKVSGVRTNLDFQWSRDPDGKVRLLVLAVPKIIRALKKEGRIPTPEVPLLPLLGPAQESGVAASPAEGERIAC